MVATSAVTVRDLRNQGGHVLDRVNRGESVTITRDGVPAAELRPVPRGSLSVSELIARTKLLPPVDPEHVRLDIDAVVDQTL